MQKFKTNGKHTLITNIMILVTGATGHLGKLTIDFLLKTQPSANVAALVRDTAKAADLAAKGVSLRTGDYFDYPSLVTALKGVDTVVLISSAILDDRLGQHVNVINAAKENGVKHIVYTSMLRTSDQSKFFPGHSHTHTEAYLKTAGIDYTILRNTFYAEVIPMLTGDALNSGEWYFATGDAKANFAARADMAEALANVAVNPAAHKNAVYEITSSTSYNFSEIAAMISKVIGKQVTYTAIPVEALVDGMRKAGVPEEYIPMTAGICGAIADGELDFVDPALENLLGRKPLDLPAALQAIMG